MSKRALLIVLDSVGIGHAPDAEPYGDAGADTVGHILAAVPGLSLPHLERVGLSTARAVAAGKPTSLPEIGSAGAMTELSKGKDTTTGHWELAGVTLDRPFAVFEHFPPDLVAAIEQEAGVTFLGNYAASGTSILQELGEEHCRTGRPILYTSADSVLQIAAHEGVMPLEKLYQLCRIARKHASSVGRVIARPFIGSPGNWQRTPNRHDYSLTPPKTVLNALAENDVPVTGVGKISDIFAGSGIATSHPTTSNQHGMEVISELWKSGTPGLIFANLVDFDMLFGHRRDPEGYGAALAEFDTWLGGFLPLIGPGDLVIVTADHGNDPTHRGTDHTRERVPVLIPSDPEPRNLGNINGFSFVADRIATYFGLTRDWNAESTSG